MGKSALVVIFLTVFIDLIGFGIVLPLLPLYSDHFGASGFVIGVISASFSVMQFIFSPIWGRLSDRMGRRPIILISLAGEAVSYAIFAWASQMGGEMGLYLLLGSRAFAGICGGNITVVQAAIADITPPEKRSASMGLIGAAFGLGFIFGPVIGALFARMGLAAPGWAAFLLCSANLLLAFFILPETWKPTSEHTAGSFQLRQWKQVLHQPHIGLLVGLFFLATFCFACYETTLALLVHRNFNYDEIHVGYLFAFNGVLSVFIQGGMIKRLVKRLGEPNLIFLSLVLLGISLLILPFFHSLPGLLFGIALLAIGSSINRPPTFGLISVLTPAKDQGITMGIAQSAGSLARILGPIFSATLFKENHMIPYVACGILSLLGGLFAWQLLRKIPKNHL
jgi:MFS family permease